LDKAYEHSDAQQRGTYMAHSVAAHSMGQQTATRVNIKALGGCRGEHRQACQQLQKVLEQHGPMLQNIPQFRR
jgi:hypothetical protein